MFEDCLILETEDYKVGVRNESIYTPNSADNKSKFDEEVFLDTEGEYISSQHGVVIRRRNGDSRSFILLAGGGASGVHENSALMHEDCLLVAVGNFVCCISLPEQRILWKAKTDWATCFGIYHSPEHECYISHGELDIARLTYDGEIVWSASGKDIFTGGFLLKEDYVEVVDFNDEIYRIDLKTGSGRYER